jgi:hypothetical protein
LTLGQLRANLALCLVGAFFKLLLLPLAAQERHRTGVGIDCAADGSVFFYPFPPLC